MKPKAHWTQCRYEYHYKQKEHDVRIGAGIVLVVLALYVLFFR